jgi:proteasome accessory factor B
MNLSRIRRLLKLIGLLQGGRGRNPESLAVDCGVSRRTVFRDLEVLRASGVPLAYDEERQQYHIPGTYFLPPTFLTSEEALAVITLCHELGSDGRLPFYDAACTAAVKLENNLPHEMREYLRSVASSVQIRTAASNPLDGRQGVYRELVSAIAKRRCARITYDSFSEGETISTRLSPYRLLFSGRSWYVIARSSLHREVRTFHVGRILQLDLLDDRYQLPRNFNLERYLKNAWQLIPEAGIDWKVVVRFRKKVARNVAEVLWHKTQQTRFEPDGSLIFECTVTGLDEISWWVMGYGDQAEVIDPPQLKRIVSERARRMVETYQMPASEPSGDGHPGEGKSAAAKGQGRSTHRNR